MSTTQSRRDSSVSSTSNNSKASHTNSNHQQAATSRPATSKTQIDFENKPSDIYARKAIMYTGPDGLRDHRKIVAQDFEQHMTGIGTRSTETSSAVGYLFRGSPNAPFPKAKNGRIGEIGWEMENLIYKY